MEDETMVFYLHIFNGEDIILVLTVNHLLFLVDAELIQTINIQDLKHCEVHKIGSEFFLVLLTHSDNQLIIKSLEYGPMAKMYTAIRSLPNKLSKKCISQINFKQRMFSS